MKRFFKDWVDLVVNIVSCGGLVDESVRFVEFSFVSGRNMFCRLG